MNEAKNIQNTTEQAVNYTDLLAAGLAENYFLTSRIMSINDKILTELKYSDLSQLLLDYRKIITDAISNCEHESIISDDGKSYMCRLCGVRTS